MLGLGISLPTIATLSKGVPKIMSDLILLLVGQSNEQATSIVAQTIDAATDQDATGIIRMWTGTSAPAAVQPLTWPSGTQTSPARGFAFAQQLVPLMAPGKKIILLPQAVGGTQLVGSLWAAPSGSLYVGALSRLTSALAAYPGASVIIEWTQGEEDANQGVTGSQYATALKAMIAGFRSVAGAERAIVISHGLVPERYQVRPLDLPYRREIIEAQQQVSVEIDDMYVVLSSLGYQISATLDPSHFTPAGQRLAGKRAYQNRFKPNFLTASAPGFPTNLTAIGNGLVTFSAASPAPSVYVIETRAAGSSDAWTGQNWYPPLYHETGETLTALVFGSGSLEIRVKARSRGGDSGYSNTVVQPGAWWHRDAVVDIDDENSRWMINGVVYASKSAMVSAGILSQSGGIDRYSLSGILPAWYVLAAKGVTASTTVGSTLRYLVALDDGADGAPTDELVVIAEGLNSTTQVIQIATFSGGTQNAIHNSAAVANSATIRAACRVRVNNFYPAVNGSGGSYDFDMPQPVVNQIVIANRDDGTRPWGGTFLRATILSSQGTVSDITGILG